MVLWGRKRPSLATAAESDPKRIKIGEATPGPSFHANEGRNEERGHTPDVHDGESAVTGAGVGPVCGGYHGGSLPQCRSLPSSASPAPENYNCTVPHVVAPTAPNAAEAAVVNGGNQAGSEPRPTSNVNTPLAGDDGEGKPSPTSVLFFGCGDAIPNGEIDVRGENGSPVKHVSVEETTPTRVDAANAGSRGGSTGALSDHDSTASLSDPCISVCADAYETADEGEEPVPFEITTPPLDGSKRRLSTVWEESSKAHSGEHGHLSFSPRSPDRREKGRRSRGRCRYILCTGMAVLAVFSFWFLTSLSIVHVQWHEHFIERAALKERLAYEHDATKSQLLTEQLRNDEYNAELKRARQEADQVKAAEKEALTRLSMAHRQISDLETQGQFVSQELTDARGRLVSLQGTKEDLNQALEVAWERIDELTTEKHDATLELTAARRSVAQLQQMKEALDEDLEESLMKIGDLEENGLALSEQLSDSREDAVAVLKEKEEATSRLKRAAERIQFLEVLLSAANEEVSASRSEIGSLQNADSENERMLHELDEQNHRMVAEIETLKTDLDRQLQEAVFAVDAVATAAATHKAEQMGQLAAAMDARVEALMVGAVEAANAVASSANARRLTELNFKEGEIRKRMDKAVGAINAVASAANEQREKEVSALRAILAGPVRGAVQVVNAMVSSASGHMFGLNESNGIETDL